MLDGINQFTATGQVDKFLEYFKETDNDNIKSLLNAARDFTDSLTLCEVTCLDEILKTRPKPAQCFTGNDVDTMPCGYPLRNIVYTSYVAKYEGKTVSEPAISQNRERYSKTTTALYKAE